MTRFLFLYTELAEYFMACARRLHRTEGVEVHIVRWPVNSEAPFRFHVPEGMGIHDRSDYEEGRLMELVEHIAPDRIICSGWIDKAYLKIVEAWAGKVPTVLILDNQWSGSFRQRIGLIWAKWRIRRAFSHVWVPGEPQKPYALKIGFSQERILDGFYTADLDRFYAFQLERTGLPARFIYMGRYIAHKGIRDLWNAFSRLVEEGKAGDWELWCCGTGDLYAERPDHPRIKHLGFVQPEGMAEVIRGTSVFILPSHFEPWGVVVQEFAASGAPLLLSDSVGASTAFLENGANGHLFPAGDELALKERMERMVNLSGDELERMSQRSHKLAAHPSPEDWVRKALSIKN
ncbi:MAG: glycosyltransferase family 4 protein [Flavobacteriales bacterium]